MKWLWPLVLLCGCPDQGSQVPGDDRLLARLKAEKDRESREGVRAPPTRPEPAPTANEPPPNPLAELAARKTPSRVLPLPAHPVFHAGGATLRLVGLEATHTVGEGISVTTDDWFLKVSLSALGADGALLDLSTSQLTLGNESFALARDAQAASKKPARVALSSQAEAKVAVFFELPEAALKPGLSLVFAGADGKADPQSAFELMSHQ